MQQLTLHAAAKLNLTLAVTGKREDGYHLLSSVMHSIGFYNTLTISAAPEFSFACDDSALPTDEKNTAVKAAQFFFEAANLPPTGALFLQKKVPYQAGMGSASADAAAALAGLNRFFGNPLTQQALLALALRVGADVPFSLQGGCCLAEGIGERLTPLPTLQSGWFCLACPQAGVSTPEAYRLLNWHAGTPQPDHAAMLAALQQQNLTQVGEQFGNCFASVCNAQQTELLCQKLLDAGALGAGLTGTGSAVFGFFAEKIQAQLASILFPCAFVVQPVENSILFA